MENLCRLCANVKTPEQLTCSIEDQTLDIEQKLIDCCRWKSYMNYETYTHMPRKICNACMKNLERSWSFAESVAQAQQGLLKEIVNMKPTVLLEIEIVHPSTSKSDDEEMEMIEEIKLSLEPFAHFQTENNFDESIAVQNELKMEDEETLGMDEIEMQRNVENPILRDKVDINFLECLSEDDKKANGTINPEKVLILNLDDWSAIKWRCYICKGMLESHPQFNAHFEQNHLSNTLRYLCPFCETSLSKNRSFMRHIIREHRPYLQHWFVF